MIDLDNRYYSKYTYLHMIATNNNNGMLDDLSAIIAFNNKINNRFF